MDNFHSFDKRYRESLALLQDYDFSPEKARVLGVRNSSQSFVLDFFNQKFEVSKKGVKALNPAQGKITPAVKFILIQYLLLCPAKTYDTPQKLVSFREFSGASPLYSSFTANTAKIVETSFSGRTEALKLRCEQLGSTPMSGNPHDLSFRFKALGRIPVIFNFNDRENMMPASASFLYHDNAHNFLDITSLMVTCTYLTGLLISKT